MVIYEKHAMQTDQLNRAFAALADPTRRAILGGSRPARPPSTNWPNRFS